jgi:hypothetical protein
MRTVPERKPQRWLVSNGFIGALLTLFSVPDLQTAAAGGLDPSWKAALHMAAHRGINHGSDLLFTYGPLGFLTEPILYYPSTALLSVAYGLAVRATFCILLVRALRRSLPLAVALIAGFLITQTSGWVAPDTVMSAATFLLCIDLLRSERPLRSRLWMVRTVALISGVHLLIKLNTGFTMVAMFGVVCLLSRDRRVLVESAAATGIGFVGGWLLSGNQPADLPAFVLGSAQLASGFSDAMGMEDPRFKGDFASVASVTAFVVFLAWSGTRDWTAARRRGAWIVLLILLFFSFKHGFVRHDGHQIGFSLTDMVAFGAFVEHQVERWVFTAGIVATLAVLLYSGAYVAMNPFPIVAEAFDDARLLTSSNRRAEEIAGTRQDLKKSWGLEEQTLDLLRGHGVHVDPWEAAVAWAYPSLRWRPLPVFQSYIAYTPGLDELNANRLAGSDGPERVLRERVSIDGRNPDWESPAAMLALVCNYEELRVQTRWQVLAKSDDRCGRAEHLSTRKAIAGEPVPIPQVEGRIVLAKIRDFKDQPSYMVRTQLWKAPVVEAVLDSVRVFRIVPGTADRGLIVKSPDSIGYSPEFVLQKASTITLAPTGAWGIDRDFTVEFVGVPVTPATRSRTVAGTTSEGSRD